MNKKQKLESIITLLNLALEDAEKFDNGNNSAGTRLRVAAQQARNELFNLRTMVQRDKNSRKGEKQ